MGHNGKRNVGRKVERIIQYIKANLYLQLQQNAERMFLQLQSCATGSRPGVPRPTHANTRTRTRTRTRTQTRARYSSQLFLGRFRSAKRNEFRSRRTIPKLVRYVLRPRPFCGPTSPFFARYVRNGFSIISSSLKLPCLNWAWQWTMWT